MSGMNSKLSVVIAAVMVFAGVTTEGFTGAADSNTEPQVVAEAEIDDISEPVEEVVEVRDEYIFRVMSASSAIEEMTTADNTQEETQTTEAQTETETESETETETVQAMVVPCTDNDYNNFLRIVEAEATGGDIKSKILVADVIINRVRRSDFPNTITDVIFQGNGQQFQPVMDGRFYTVNVTESTVEAVDRALYGEDYSQGATFFAARASAGAGSWHASALTRLFEYGGHVYFIN